MNVIESIVALLAPHCCLICKKEGAPLCNGCVATNLVAMQPICYRCRRPSSEFQICCDDSHLSYLYIATKYRDSAKDIVALLKFQRTKAAALVIALVLSERIPSLPPDTVVCPVPTANRRIRERGYDQACLIAKAFAKMRELPYRQLLIRQNAARQVGSGREQRVAQAEQAFRLRSSHQCENVLLIDDVLTTGATLEAAARVVRQGGATDVRAAVFAH